MFKGKFHPISRKLAVVLAIVVFAFTACTATPEATQNDVDSTYVQPLVSISGKLVPQTWAMISSNTGGTVKAVLVEQGDTVAKGDVLIQFDDADAQIALLQANASLESALANLERVRVGAREEETALVQAQVLSAQSILSQTISQRDQLIAGQYQADLAAAEAQIAAMQEMQFNAQLIHDDTMKCVKVTHPDGGTSEVCPALGRPEEQARYALNSANHQLTAAEVQRDAIKTGYYAQLKAADAAIAVAESQLQIAELQLALVQAEVLPEDIAIALAAVNQAQAQVQAAELAVTHMQIAAPYDGTVVDINIRVGEALLPGSPTLTLGNLETLYIETTDLDEIDVANVQEGQQVIVTFEALPDATFTGTLADIALINSDTGSGVSYTAHIVLDEGDPRLRWGMTAFIDINVEE